MLGFRKTGKPGLTWLTGSYAPEGVQTDPTCCIQHFQALIHQCWMTFDQHVGSVWSGLTVDDLRCKESLYATDRKLIRRLHASGFWILAFESRRLFSRWDPGPQTKTSFMLRLHGTGRIIDRLKTRAFRPSVHTEPASRTKFRRLAVQKFGLQNRGRIFSRHGHLTV